MARQSHTRPVVLIDDSEEDLFLARRLLNRAGISNPVVTLDGGPPALAFFQGLTGQPVASRELPLVIFCDIKMPVMNGFDVLKWVRAQPPLAQVPVYMLSGSDLDADKSRAASLGATGYLVKFPGPDEFRNLINRVAGNGNGSH